jgi:PelA/Pel-15E family pectate lyase
MITPVRLLALLLGLAMCAQAQSAAPANGLRDEALAALRKATAYYHSKVARHGGYVYYTSDDLSQRWGEGKAAPDQIWVQPPGTPAVGMAFLAAYKATKEPPFLNAARDAAQALVQGQLESGGWTNYVDFAARGKNAPRFRKLPGGTRNHSSLDDGVTQSALRFLFQMDEVLEFKDADIHTAAKDGLDALLKAQFTSGGFPQGWSGPVPAHPPAKAAYPDYDWRTENRIKNYWELPTLNDDLVLHLVTTLEEGWRIYRDDRCKEAIVKLGEFLLRAQMPDPQPAWAQQYDHQMHPVWARKFEPPAIAGRESQGALRTLLEIHRITRDAKFLEPFPKALAYLKRSLLPDGKLARYYELQTNKPLYMDEQYQLTYDDARAPKHYGWKSDSRLESIEKRLEEQKSGKFRDPLKPKSISEETVRTIVRSLDAEGRWLSINNGPEALVGQPKFAPGQRYLSSEVFNKNVGTLAAFLAQPR